MDIPTQHLAALGVLQQAFTFFNKTLFHNALPKVVINMAPGKTNPRTGSSTLGWFRPTSWVTYTTGQNEGGEDTVTTSPDPVHEINMCPDPLRSSPQDVLETLIHEMVHLFNCVAKIEDVRKGSQFHNKKFKEAAENAGLEVERQGNRGWAKTSLGTRAQTQVDAFAAEADINILQLNRPIVKIVKENPFLTVTLKKDDFTHKLELLQTHLNCEGNGDVVRSLVNEAHRLVVIKLGAEPEELDDAA